MQSKSIHSKCRREPNSDFPTILFIFYYNTHFLSFLVLFFFFLEDRGYLHLLVAFGASKSAFGASKSALLVISICAE